MELSNIIVIIIIHPDNKQITTVIPHFFQIFTEIHSRLCGRMLTFLNRVFHYGNTKFQKFDT